MLSFPAAVTVVGAGAYGTALAINVARNGHRVVLWGRDGEHLAQMQRQRVNQRSLPGHQFPPSLAVEEDLATAIGSSRNVLLVVPSFAFGEMLLRLKPYLADGARLVWATKGLEAGSGRLLQEVARDLLGETIPLAVLAGPTFAKELAEGLPTAITVAATHTSFAVDLQELLHCSKSFRVYQNSDFIGVQLGGAVKNIIAIAAGISDGLGFGVNARAALITRGLVEMTRLGVALDAVADTFVGMAGLGDLVLTCTDDQSRNRRFGILLGQGNSPNEAMNAISQLVEGFPNSQEVRKLALRCDVEMPISEQVYQVLYCAKNPREAALDLLNRRSKEEKLR